MRIRLKIAVLQQHIARAALSQNHWAIKLGLSKGHFSNLLSGRHPWPSARTRERMLEVLGLPFDELFEIEPGDLPDHGVQSALHDRYLIDREIGQGGMGAVYLARDARLGRPVAIKIVNPEAVSEVGAPALVREIVQTTRLQHPNILPILDAGEADESPFYVMPWVDGGSLRDAIARQGRLPIGRALSILGGIAGALDYAHTVGVLHCDVKPANVLLADDHAWLIDFGIARVLQAEVFAGEYQGELNSGAGTPAYVSPEQARGDAKLDGRSDVYSLACMMFEMLTGQPPFRGPTTLATVGMRFTSPVPDARDVVPSLPRELAEALQRAMTLEPADRTPSAGAFLEDCQDAVALAGSVVGVPASHRVTRLPLLTRLAGAAESAAQNVRFAWRSIARAPGVAVAIALTLGLGVGVNTTMFGMLDRMFFRAPPHIDAPGQLRRIFVRLNFRGREVTTESLSYPALGDFRGVGAFSGAAGFFATTLSADRGARATEVPVLMASANYFPLLGVAPAYGRFFGEAEAREGVGGTAVLGYDYWRRRFGGRRDAIGQVLRLGSGTYTVVGIAPKGFSGLDWERVDVFLPLRNAAHENIGGPWETSRGVQWVRVVARLAAGTTPAQAEAQATTVLRAAQREVRTADPRAAVVAGPILEARGPTAGADTRIAMWLGGVSLVLLVVAAANVVNLLFARLAEREGELAVRTALGAGRARIVGQLLIEAVILALLAAATGMLLADLCSMLLGRLLLPGVELPPAWADPRLLLFAVGAAVVAGAAAAIVPALRSTRSDLAASLKAGRGAGRARSRVTGGLVIFQATLSLLLLVGAGLFLRSAWKIRSLDAGIAMDRLLIASVDYTAADFTPERAALAQREAMEGIAALPGVAGVAGSNSVPFQSSWAESLEIPGIDSIPSSSGGGPYINMVGPDYFGVVGTPIRRGRGFDERDRAGAARVAVVGESMARIVWGGRNPIGECLRIDTMPCAEIVGIAQDAPRGSLLRTETMQYYVPADQMRPGVAHEALFVRTERDPDAMVNAVRGVLQQASPDLPLVSVQPLWELARPETRPWELGATIFSVFGVLAMLVAVIGLYSVLAFSVARRRREFGVRTALGASAGNVTGLVIRGGLRLVIAGVVLGGLLSLVAARWLAPLLYETRAFDPLVLAVSVGLLLVSASIACLVPAIRATRVSPMEALRSE